MTKQVLRTQIKSKARTLPHDLRQTEAQTVIQKTLQFPDYKSAKAILAYRPFAYELDILPLVKDAFLQNKQIYFPQVNKDTKALIPTKVSSFEAFLTISQQGSNTNSKQSDILTALDLILVPGIGFTQNGNRLGTGFGYYDRLLANYPHVTKIALVHSYQLVKTLPKDPWDIKVDTVISV